MAREFITRVGSEHAILMVPGGGLGLRRSKRATHIRAAGGLVFLGLLRSLEHEIERSRLRLRVRGWVTAAVFGRSRLRFGGKIRAVAIGLERWNEICIWSGFGEELGHRERRGCRRRMEGWPCIGGTFL